MKLLNRLLCFINTNKEQLKLILLILLIFALISFFDYISGGFWSLIILAVFIVMAFVVIVLVLIISCLKSFNIKRDIFIMGIGICLPIAFIICDMYFKSVYENIDWFLGYKARNRLVNQIIQNKIIPEDNGSYKISGYFPILSHGGNEIVVRRYTDNTVSVSFYITRLIFFVPCDYWVYTNNLEVVRKLYINGGTNMINKNWFRVNAFEEDFSGNYMNANQMLQKREN